jgi:phosphoenolpyruvate-protein phosphotransferase
MKSLKGIPASKGIAIGPIFRYQSANLQFQRYTPEDLEKEWGRLESALRTARNQLSGIIEKAAKETSAAQAAIFEAQSEMLDDPELLNAMREIVLGQGQCAEVAVTEATEKYALMLETLSDPYFVARAADIRDISKRVLRILLDISESPTAGLAQPSIIIANDLTPSDTIGLDKSLVLGFCTAEGGSTSHTAILARSLGLPAIVGVGSDIENVAVVSTAVLDGDEGSLFFDPPADLLQAYRQKQKAAASLIAAARQEAHAPAITRDNHQVEVVANIGNVAGAETAIQCGAEGVGLLRTEFLYLERSSLPDEEEQYQAYRAILDTFGMLPVVLRTLDIGGDKEIPYLGLTQELNPFLGVRAIRLCLQRPDLFRPQLKAALRAGVGRNLKLMFPMVAVVDEIQAARKVLDECRAELRTEGKSFAEKIEVGIMVEIPSAAVMADRLAPEVDFFSIGTNDLTQYTLAADRTSGDLNYLTSAFSPAVLRLVSFVIQSAHRFGKWVGLCGELAGEPLAIPILLGLGLDEFSMNPPAIPLAKKIIRTLSLEDVQEFARTVLDLDSPSAVQQAVRDRFPASAP